MKVRIGIGLGRSALEPDELAGLGSDIGALGFDSIWLSEVLSGGGYDPLVGLAYLAGRVPSLKLGTTMLLPGRNPARLAKSLASLDRLSGGNLLVTFVPGLTEGVERMAIGVEPNARGAVIEEMLPIVRRLLAGEIVSYDGPAGRVESIRTSPRPVQEPLEFWLGGMAKSSLERCGRLGDGWLPSLCTPAEAAKGRAVIEAVAASSSRTIDPEHFGVNINYSFVPIAPEVLGALARRSRGNDPATLIPVGSNALRRLIREFLEAGISKFVLRPQETPTAWRPELERLADSVGDLQS